jgi:predicted  nucleic acid-binding Zn-ribbon protein
MIAREKDVLVAVVDIESGAWKMAREIFEVLQKEMAYKKKTISEINIQAIQEVATEIGGIVKNTSNIRGKTAKMQNLIEKYKLEIKEDLDEIKAAVEKHQKKLMAAVGEMGNERKETLPMTQKVKSVSMS